MNSKTSTPILILGMGRSGTSCLAGSLQQAGVYFGKVSTANKHNIKGNRENDAIMKLNDEILHYNNAQWNNPPLKIIKWNTSHEAHGQELIHQFTNETTSQYWGFKDPRTLLTYPFWEKILPNAKLVGTVRHPYHVALSLDKRGDKTTLEESMNLWLSYNIKLLKLLEAKPFPLISFDASSSDYTKHQNILIKKVLPDSKHSIDFYDQKLRSNTGDIAIDIPENIQQCYLALLKYTIS